MPFFEREVDWMILSIEIEQLIEYFIEEKSKEDGLGALSDSLLRDKTLELLDKYCTVVYYPLEDESNNGFRVKNIPFLDGSQRDFVFINTAQTIEKQIFTAAHELGHIWNVDDFVLSKTGYELAMPEEQYKEAIINRFAATFLMPSKKFRESANGWLGKYASEDKKTISHDNMLKAIVNLMNDFYVPHKAVALRLAELQFISEKDALTLSGDNDISKEKIEERIKEIESELGFVFLQKSLQKKWIEGLSEKLEIAERERLLSESKIKKIREKFEIKPSTALEHPDVNDITIDAQGAVNSK